METSRSESLYCLSDHCQACPLLTEIPSVWTVVFKPPVIVAAGQQLSVWCLGRGQSHTSAGGHHLQPPGGHGLPPAHTGGHWATRPAQQGAVSNHTEQIFQTRL